MGFWIFSNFWQKWPENSAGSFANVEDKRGTNHLAPRVTTVHPHLIKFIVSKTILSWILTLAPNLSLKWVFEIFKIFGRNDLKIQLDHVWTMRGPSFANVKDKRGTKERPPGPNGYRCPPPPPDAWIWSILVSGSLQRGPNWTVVTLGARWPLLSPPFVLYIGKTWTSHGPNMVQFNFQVISAKNFKN